jgi:hypothetical protein
MISMSNDGPLRSGNPGMPRYAVGDLIRLSPAGKARLSQMPEAWGMHGAAARDEMGVVIEVIEGEDGLPAALSVEFESGAVYNWEADQFEPAE